MVYCLVSEQEQYCSCWALWQFFKDVEQSTLTAHTNTLTKILFTIHSGLGTVNIKVIIGGNQMLNPSAVQGC